jgi:hypothetical protein
MSDWKCLGLVATIHAKRDEGFDAMPGNTPSQQQSAKHLAARAVMAYRAGFPVVLVSVTSSRKRPSGIVCDWKGQRDSFQNDEKLLGRAFAFVYIGSIMDQAISDPISDELRKELVSDMSSALDARQTAVDWGVAKAVADTNPFAHTGYKLVSRLLRMDLPLIESLARELTSQGTIEGDALKKWLDGNASPLNLDELETITTY